jgi:hypothetical protein
LYKGKGTGEWQFYALTYFMQVPDEIDLKDDLAGPMSVKFKTGSPVEDFCAKRIEGYNPERYKVLALRLFYGKEIVLTIYAVDKEHFGRGKYAEGVVPVKKFKLNNLYLRDLLPFIEECNFTLTTGEYPVKDMEVINK